MAPMISCTPSIEILHPNSLIRDHQTKIMALVLAVMMVLGVATAIADDPVTVKVTNGEYDSDYYTPTTNEINYATHSYKAAQILAATGYDSTSKEYSGLTWGAQVTDPSDLLAALKADSVWGSTFENFVVDAAGVTESNTQFTAASFANAISGANTVKATALAQVLKSLYANQGTSITGIAEVTLPGIGYYLIDDVTTGLNDDAANPVILFAAPGSNKIRIKAEKPSQDKQVKENESSKAEWNEVSDYSIGDAVPYKITSKVPNVEAYKTYNMKFTDEMSAGLTLFDNWTGETPTNTTTFNLKVTVGTTVVTENATITKNDHGFVLTLPVKANNTLASWATAGADITIEFFGVLNQSAVIGLDGNTNKSKLEYSNNPDDDNSKTETPYDTVITFTYELDVTKIDGTTADKDAAEQIKLPGAQFALKATDGEHNGKYAVVNAQGKIVKWQDAAPAADATADSDGNTALLVSGTDGIFKIIGLDDGKYSLEEIKAPDGYNLIQPVAIEIVGTTVHTADGETASTALTGLNITAGGKTTAGSIDSGIVETTVINNSGATLPETGGIGTQLFYIGGGLLALIAVVLLVTKRRMSAE